MVAAAAAVAVVVVVVVFLGVGWWCFGVVIACYHTSP
jgi:hypothetical protein